MSRIMAFAQQRLGRVCASVLRRRPLLQYLAWQPQKRTLADLGKGVDLLEDDTNKKRTFLLGYDSGGFEVRDISYRGSIMAFPESCFLWKAETVEDITAETLSPITLVKPPIEIVVIGTGERFDKPVAKEAIEFLTSKGVVVEQMDTGNACSLFNILNQEDRRVAGALIVAGSASRKLEAGTGGVGTE